MGRRQTVCHGNPALNHVDSHNFGNPATSRTEPVALVSIGYCESIFSTNLTLYRGIIYKTKAGCEAVQMLTAY